MATEGGGGFGDALVVIGIFILIFFVWVASGGPNKPISQGGFFLTSPKPISTGEATGTGALLDYRAPRSLLPRVQSPTRTDSPDDRKDQEETEKEVGSLERSEYRGIVSFSRSTSGARKVDAKNENLRISVSKRAESPVNVSGWKVVSAITGKNAVIPLGTELPLSGIISEQELLELNPGDDAYIITGRSPIGASFRINSCLGYFGQYQSFTPTLKNSCPLPEDELKEFSGIDFYRDTTCENFVEDIPRCSIATSIPAYVSDSCRAFVESSLNYNGCVRLHQNDEDFFDDEWRIYLGRSSELWKESREVIRLYDASGKLVDQISY
ncbi:MAG: hypothetical protein ACJKSS_00825 [Patescibacteria group bacterium UBA2103]